MSPLPSMDSIKRQISKRGFAVIWTYAPVDLAFTVGLAGSGLPELALRGTPEALSRTVLTDAARKIVSGEEISPGSRIVHRNDTLWTIAEEYTKDEALSCYSKTLYGEDVRVLLLSVHQRA